MNAFVATDAPPEFEPHGRCPMWVGYLLSSPLRRLFENPEPILAPYVRSGDTVVDLGCAMGFFSLPLARLVGGDGRVVCVDVQEKMLHSVEKKARRKKLDHVIETRVAGASRLGLDDLAGAADLALAWHVVHEVPDPAGFLKDAFDLLRPGGRLLFAEPSGHVGRERVDHEIELARQAGFEVVERRNGRRSDRVVFAKPE